MIAALAVLIAGAGEARAQSADLWQALREGRAVALVRHALAPGTGDPPGFRLEDCSTQRNLSAEGRAQARALGERLRANGVATAEVYSSQWCRCLETARLLDLGSVTPLPALNSFFGDRSEGPAQTAAVRRFLTDAPAEVRRVLVTHQVNITALAEVLPRSGEIVVVAPGDAGELEVLGRIAPP